MNLIRPLHLLSGLLLLAGIASPQTGRCAETSPAPAGEFRWKDCYVLWAGDTLRVGNACFERAWLLKQESLQAVSLFDKETNTEWLKKPAASPAQASHGLLITAAPGKEGPTEEESLLVEVALVEKPARRWRLQLFPRQAALLWRAMPASVEKSQAEPAKTAASGIEAAPDLTALTTSQNSLETWAFAFPHLRLTGVELLDQTDVRDELVFEKEWLLSPKESLARFSGNIFSLEDVLTGTGVVLVKLAPLPHARSQKLAWDFVFSGTRRSLQMPADHYPVAVQLYSGGRQGRTSALHSLQRRLRPYVPGRDGLLLSNTWGDRSRDAAINEPFIRAEIAAGARLGVDVIQIDDGWETGITANSARGKGAWGGYWATDANFWKPSTVRFPSGLEPVVADAKARGMGFGLWFGPDSSNGMANWERDADCLLDLHRRVGIDSFKIDSVKTTDLASEKNLWRFFEKILRESAGKVVFDLDVTAEIRPGYLGATGVGPVFVENRYTDFGSYWPHHTLRNLWRLSQYIDPVRLRMEFLNNTRRTEVYGADPLAPGKWKADTLFAITLVASPLGFFEVSKLPESYITAVAPLVATWKRERARMQGGRTLPIGEAPDGLSWTGFSTVCDGGGSAYVLLFRELNAAGRHSVALPGFAPDKAAVTVLGGRGSASYGSSRLEVSIPETLDFLWVRLDAPAR